MPMIQTNTITCDGTDCNRDMTGKNPAVVRIHGGLRETINIKEDHLFLCDDCIENNNFKFKTENIAELKAEAEAKAKAKAKAEAEAKAEAAAKMTKAEAEAAAAAEAEAGAAPTPFAEV